MALAKVSRILVPIDGSKSSMRAADAAIELARRYSDDSEKALAEVIALYVIDINPKLHLFGKYGFHYSEYADKAKEEARKATGEWFSMIKERAERHNLRFRSEVADNSAASIVGEIVHFAER